MGREHRVHHAARPAVPAACRLVAAAAIGLLSVTSVAAETPSRDPIIVEGNRRVEAETVRSYFRAAPDGRFDAAACDAALKALVATGLFDKVSIERVGERIVVRVTEAPVLDRVLRRQPESKRRRPICRDRIQAARHAAARGGTGGCRPHHRGLSACRA